MGAPGGGGCLSRPANPSRKRFPMHAELPLMGLFATLLALLNGVVLAL